MSAWLQAENELVVVLDSNIVAAWPKVLGLSLGHVKLIIPESAASPLILAKDGLKKGGINYTGLLVQARDLGTIEMTSLASPIGSYRFPYDSSSEYEFLQTAKEVAEDYPDSSVVVATTDGDLASLATDLGFATMAMAELKNAMRGAQSPDVAFYKQLPVGLPGQVKSIVVNGLLGALAVGIVALVSPAVFGIATMVNVWVAISLLPVVGIALFWFRAQHRLSYGMIEFGLGVLAAAWVFYPEFDYSALSVVSVIQLAAGLYMMIRGLDNIGKGLEHTPLHDDWRRWFPQ